MQEQGQLSFARTPYFNNLYKKIVDDLNKGKVEIDSKTVLDALKKYHQETKNEEISAIHTLRIEEQIQHSLISLSQHEHEWKELHDASHNINMQIVEKEKLIEEEIEKFKKLVRRLTYTRKVPPEKHFKLTDGRVIANIASLMATLPQISDELFKNHVNNERNDFANWISNVFEDKELGEQVKKCHDRKELYSALKNAVEIGK